MRRIRKSAVIGSGVMGGGIAALLASAGINTLLLDIVPPDLTSEQKKDKTAKNRIAKAGLDSVLRSSPALLMHPGDAARISIGNLEDDFDRLSECDWIIEVVVENLKIKQELFKRLEPVRKKDAIVSSNTSGIPLKKITEGLGKPFREHFLGTHFFNPVRYMKLLEIIPGEDTLPEILEFMADLGERILGKGIVWAKDTPNFVGNRVGVFGMVKTMQLMLEDQLTIPEVDALFGPAMGRPKTAMFRTADLVGLDTLGHVAQNTFDLAIDDDQRDSFVIPEFVQKMIAQKILGNKTRGGFYKTDLTPDWKKIYKVINPATLEYAEYAPPDFPCLAAAAKAKNLSDKIKAVIGGDDKGSLFAWKVLAYWLIYAAERIPEIADTIVEVDNATRWGFNFEMGPFETWDSIGLLESVGRMEKEGFKVPQKVLEMIADGHRSFYEVKDGKTYYWDFGTKSYKERIVSDNIISLFALRGVGRSVESCKSASLVDLGDGVFCCEFHTKMNSLNEEILEFLNKSLDYVDRNGAGLIIGNQTGGVPSVFSAGADLIMMSNLAKEKRYDLLEGASKTLQDLLQRFRYETFPVVAAPHGLALGGGCEICLAADKVVAHAELYMGLVEIGVGLLPAGCGCLNLWKNFLTSIPESVSDVDLAKFFLPVFMNIAMAKVSTSAADAKASGFLEPIDRIVFNRDYLIGEAKKEVLKMVADGYSPPIKRNIKVLGQAAQGMVQAEILNMLEGKFISEYDAFLVRRIAFVISGGEVRDKSEISEDVILKLEREAFADFWKEEKTLARVEHMLKTGKPLRN